MKTIFTIFVSLAATSAVAASHGHGGAGMAFNPEQRKQMADMHMKAAECLNSSKSIQECQQEMMKNCPMVKDGHCPMMSMGMGPGMGAGGTTTPTPAKSKIK